MSNNNQFDCYAYSISIRVTENECLQCSIGMNGCPAYPYEEAQRLLIIEPEQWDLWGNPIK
jgi:heterodisulfide reductase subunit C